MGTWGRRCLKEAYAANNGLVLDFFCGNEVCGSFTELRESGRAPRVSAGTPRPWLAAPSPRHILLIRRHLRTGELAFHYCFVPQEQLARPRRG
jgi:hypothetical protein